MNTLQFSLHGQDTDKQSSAIVDVLSYPNLVRGLDVDGSYAHGHHIAQIHRPNHPQPQSVRPQPSELTPGCYGSLYERMPTYLEAPCG